MLGTMPGLDLPDDLFLDVFNDAPIRTLAPGEVLINAGAPADQVFNIVSGVMRMTRTGTDGRRQVLAFLFRDNFVGLTTTDCYFFGLEAVTDARVACCPRRRLDERLAADPAAERAFMNMMSRVIEDMLDIVFSLGQRTAHERLAVFLLYLRHWRRLTDSIVADDDPLLNNVDLPMSREDIADFLGLTKETVSRSFRELEEQALILRDGSHRTVLRNLSGLRELAGVSDFAAPRRIAPTRT
jgi:CRP/FNR family transcriptional regulator